MGGKPRLALVKSMRCVRWVVDRGIEASGCQCASESGAIGRLEGGVEQCGNGTLLIAAKD